MSVNKQLVERFERMSQMIELLGGDRFRVNAHARVARAIKDQPRDLEADKKALTAIDGIGAKSADKIIEFIETGRIAEYDELLEQVPAGLLAVLDIPGLGPKTVKLMWDELGITDMASLKKAIDEDTIAGLPRMGKKTVDNIKASIKFAESSGDRLWLGMALPIAEAICEYMAEAPGVKNLAYAGSLRRGKDTIGDIDILMATSKPDEARERFTTMPGVDRVLAKGDTKSSIRVRAGSDRGRWGKDSSGGPMVQVDLRLVPQESWGAALLYFTGSKDHNVRLRERALKKNLTLNEYGLYPLDKDDTPPQRRGVKAVASKTEEDIYEVLGVVYVAPEIREDAGELALSETPRLIEFDDIVSELHAHTTASDGKMTLAELVKEAKRREYEVIAVTDHSQSSAQAGGLDPERLREQIEAVHAHNKKTRGIIVLAGSEVDIHADGTLDYDDELLHALDIVVASPHASLKQDAKVATARLIKAIEHPMTHIIGHPTGRLINRRPGLEPAMDEVIAAAVEHDTALEINAHWMRLDLRDTHVRAAVEAGCLIAIDTDAHTPEDFDNLIYGVLTGRRGWLTADQCINTWSANDLQAWLKKKR